MSLIKLFNRHVIGCCAMFLLLSASAMADDWPGTKKLWNGFDCYEFEMADRACKVVTPKTPHESHPWIWRARFWGHEPQTDIVLLNKGFHLVYMDVANLFGSPKAVELWNKFYDFLRSKGLSEKCVLEGMSRGGLIIYNWAVANPTKVACIYGDAPVCDVKSWPGGKGDGPGSAGDWQRCLKAYDMDEMQMMAYKGNPIDRLKPLVKFKIPLINVCGAADKVVPIKENTHIMQKRYNELGGLIKVIEKEGVGHHPHSLKNPKPIVDFILEHTLSPNNS